jgi:hypothetical protein
VIISLCRNPDGLLWAGDTAQTISIGSTFTFKQLGASVYRYQVCNPDSGAHYNAQLTASAEIDPSPAWNSPSARRLSASRQLSFSWWYRRMCQRHNPVVATVSRCNRCFATRGGSRRKGAPQVFPWRYFQRAEFLPFVHVSELKPLLVTHISTNVFSSGQLSKLGHNQCM